MWKWKVGAENGDGDGRCRVATLALGHVALCRGEGGVISELASYFKSPLQFPEHDFFKQVNALRELISAHIASDAQREA